MLVIQQKCLSAHGAGPQLLNADNEAQGNNGVSNDGLSKAQLPGMASVTDQYRSSVTVKVDVSSSESHDNLNLKSVSLYSLA